MKEAGLSQASVYSYIPYVGLAYNLTETTVNADRHRLFRQRVKACQELTEHMDCSDSEDYLWKAIIAFENYPFKTAKGLKYHYTVKRSRTGQPIGEIVFDRKEKSITRSTVVKGFENAVAVQKRKGYVSGPKKLGVFGASYLYPVFFRLEVCKGQLVAEKNQQVTLLPPD